jgi:type IV pilus assembly protein PilW
MSYSPISQVMRKTIHHTALLRPGEQGFSLVELMVAVTISFILMAGISHIFLGSKTSYNLQDGLGRLQENARFALDILHHSISMTAYSGTLLPLNNAIDSTNSRENYSANASLGFITASKTASDTIEVHYTSTTDCLGNATGGEAHDRFYVDGTNLMCLGNGSGTAGVIAEGVENMQILYGEDTNNDAIANVYVNADNITDWNAIISVRVAVLVSTVQAVGNGTADNKTHVLLNTPAIGPINDHVIRRVFTRTIILRNKLI